MNWILLDVRYFEQVCEDRSTVNKVYSALATASVEFGRDSMQAEGGTAF
jgi:hypothetical protein